MARHAWAKHVIKDFETSPRIQLRFHLAMMRVWELNAVVVTALFFADNAGWLKIGVFYCVLISLYSNWDTDLDAVAACTAAVHGEELLGRQAPDR